MSMRQPSPKSPSWSYVVLAVLMAAIGAGWGPEDIRALGYMLLALLAIAYAAQRGS
ncbi:hypothetical protein SAMN05428944_2768 [Streptomyces sp. 1222.5]|nr:hypothetical protein BX260_5324 [Streptomyces sp. 5112.2]SEC16848.1 hypothetical protein SAMN05428944_2768 [Streptomyces sp. 1222.5]